MIDGPMVTLVDLQRSARSMGYAAEVIGTGGNVVALSLTVDGGAYLIALDDGQRSGCEWAVANDGPARDTVELESGPMPISSDADQTIADAVAWVRWVAAGGDPLAAPSVIADGAPFHGVCDGCPSGLPQNVRTVRGEWGAATVCSYHETHTD